MDAGNDGGALDFLSVFHIFMNFANMNKGLIHIHISQFILFIFVNSHEHSTLISFGVRETTTFPHF